MSYSYEYTNNNTTIVPVPQHNPLLGHNLPTRKERLLTSSFCVNVCACVCVCSTLSLSLTLNPKVICVVSESKSSSYGTSCVSTLPPLPLPLILLLPNTHTHLLTPEYVSCVCVCVCVCVCGMTVPTLLIDVRGSMATFFPWLLPGNPTPIVCGSLLKTVSIGWLAYADTYT